VTPGRQAYGDQLAAVRLRCINYGGTLDETVLAGGPASGATQLTCLPGAGSPRALTPMRATVLSRGGRSVYLFVTAAGKQLPASLASLADGLSLP
jgi:hypothetical protein